MIEDVLRSINSKIKLKSIKCGIFAKIPDYERDRVLGFLIKSPGLITRRYTTFVNTDIYKKYPYCLDDSTNLIYH